MTCDQYSAYARPCNRNGERKDTLLIQYGFLSLYVVDLLESVVQQAPVYQPNAKSTYSNLGFELLGLAIENTTGVDYSKHLHEIFKELNMNDSTFDKPNDNVAVIPAVPNYWDIELGIKRSSYGMYR